MVDEEDDNVKPIKKKIKKPIDDEEDDVKKPIKKKKTKRELEEEEIKLLRTIFVGNLPTTVKKKHLIREFSQFGHVDTARMRSVALVDVRLFLQRRSTSTCSVPAKFIYFHSALHCNF